MGNLQSGLAAGLVPGAGGTRRLCTCTCTYPCPCPARLLFGKGQENVYCIRMFSYFEEDRAFPPFTRLDRSSAGIIVRNDLCTLLIGQPFYFIRPSYLSLPLRLLSFSLRGFLHAPVLRRLFAYRRTSLLRSAACRATRGTRFSTFIKTRRRSEGTRSSANTACRYQCGRFRAPTPSFQGGHRAVACVIFQLKHGKHQRQSVVTINT